MAYSCDAFTGDQQETRERQERNKRETKHQREIRETRESMADGLTYTNKVSRES